MKFLKSSKEDEIQRLKDELAISFEYEEHLERKLKETETRLAILMSKEIEVDD